MRLQIRHHESDTLAKSPSLGLLYWFLAETDRGEVPPDLPPLTLHVGRQVPSNDSPDFLPAVLAAIERRYGYSPAVPEIAPGEPGYESTCLGVLAWLLDHGSVEGIIITQSWP